MAVVQGTPGLCDVQIDGAVITIIPLDDVARERLKTFHTAHGAKTTIAFTQSSVGRNGIAVTDGSWKAEICTAS